jgi:glycosyltransferase involved in cell wall biosynthesis
VLTVGIPTYNRREAVARRLDELLSADLPVSIDILVIDNASPDDTTSFLLERFADSPVRILTNESNLGYAGNVFRLFDEAGAPHLMIDSDEDSIDPAGLVALAEFCAQRHPLFVSPRAQVGTDELYRGRASTRPIEPAEFESASFYVSGLTYDVEFVRGHLAAVRAQVPSNSAVTVYPQVALAALCVAEGRSWFFDQIVTRQVESHATAIVDPRGGHYGTVVGRWSGFVGFEEFFAETLSTAPPAQHPALMQMRQRLRSGLPALLLGAAAIEVPELRSAVDDVINRPSLLGRLAAFLRVGG